MTGDDLGASFPDDERSIELESLTAIFPEIMRDPGDPFTAFIEIPVAAAKPFALPTPESAPGRCAGEPPPPQPPQQQQHMLTYLPPLSLRFSLPLGYPDEKPPCFELGTGQPSWLPAQIARRLVDDGKRMWEDLGRGPIVYDFIDQLIHEAEAVFNLVSDDGVARLDTPPNVSLALLDFDAKMRRKVFEQETFECGVCLSTFEALVVCYGQRHVSACWNI
jgi:E3 ubiquitin-protein ligase RNF14